MRALTTPLRRLRHLRPIGSEQNIADRSSGGGEPAKTAESLCAAVGNHIEDMQVMVTVEDGMGDYLVWLKNANEELWVCNASGEAKLYDFEPVDLPLNDTMRSSLVTPDASAARHPSVRTECTFLWKPPPEALIDAGVESQTPQAE